MPWALRAACKGPDAAVQHLTQLIVDHCGPIKDVDPEAAAKRRAARRQEAIAAAAFSVAGSADIPEDLADAEEDDPEVGT